MGTKTQGEKEEEERNVLYVLHGGNCEQAPSTH